MDYDSLKYILINLDNIPEKYRSGDNRIYKLNRAIINYSIVGIPPENYHLVSSLRHLEISKEEAFNGYCWWGEIRSQKMGYKDFLINGRKKTEKSLISVQENDLEYAMSLMKKLAKLLIEDEIARGNPDYNRKGILELFENASDIRTLNKLYEDYIGIEMPRSQALEMKLFNENGKRIFKSNRLFITELRCL